LLLLVAPLALFLLLRPGDTNYPHGQLLIEPSQLARRRLARLFIILDARERTKYEQAHVPNARWVDRAAWAAAFGHGQDAEGWSRRIGELGIGTESRVVVYDDNFSRDAAPIWWMLRYWGVEDVRLLNGGWTGWTGGAYPIDKTMTVPDVTAFVARARASRLATKEQLLQSLHGNLQIVDARSELEFSGTEKLKNKRAGAIPGAKQLEWINLIETPTQRFKPAADLRRLFDRAIINLDRPVTAYCQSGVRSSVLAFALELMGARDVSSYLPGWIEWSNADDTPVAAGKPTVPK